VGEVKPQSPVSRKRHISSILASTKALHVVAKLP
jgi:hypothetical protein